MAPLGLFNNHRKVNGRHNGIAEVFVHPALNGGSVDIYRLVEPIDGSGVPAHWGSCKRSQGSSLKSKLSCVFFSNGACPESMAPIRTGMSLQAFPNASRVNPLA